MKKTNWAVAALILTAMTIASVACNKEKTDEIQRQKITKDQFEEIGEMHNEILWNIGVEFKEDLHNIVLNNGISEADAMTLQARIEDWGKKYISIQMNGVCDSLLKNWHIDVAWSTNAIITDSLLNLILDQATSMDDLFKKIEEHEDEIYSNMTSLNDTIQLLSLVIMRHSLGFWIDAYYNIENPWHEIAYYMPYPIDSKGLPGIWNGIKKWAKEKVAPFIMNIATAVVELVAMDFITWTACTAKWTRFGALLGVPQIGFGASVVFSAMGSAAGGVYGWTHPLF